jgi:lipopolysaccharide/colanic/teichoic acid biosynthesis glycosyltransferase
MRRIVDIGFSVCAITILAPLFFLVAFLVWVRDGRPVLYSQKRAGLRGETFLIYKFRTMSRSAGAIGGPLTFRADARITRMGRFLRRYKLDEFPQLWNVLKGDMTIVGPRPEVLEWVARYDPEERVILEHRPGLTDPVQLLFRHEQDFLESKEQYDRLFHFKVSKQIEYGRTRSFVSDLCVVLRTPFAIVMRRPNQQELALYRALGCTGVRGSNGENRDS